jgi:hypothetical protein
MTSLTPSPVAETAGVQAKPSNDVCAYDHHCDLQAHRLRKLLAINLPLAISLAPLVFGAGS